MKIVLIQSDLACFTTLCWYVNTLSEFNLFYQVIFLFKYTKVVWMWLIKPRYLFILRVQITKKTCTFCFLGYFETPTLTICDQHTGWSRFCTLVKCYYCKGDTPFWGNKRPQKAVSRLRCQVLKKINLGWLYTYYGLRGISGKESK